MDEANLPPGFRFHPSDEELITYYLNNKVSDFNFTSRAITDVDLNKSEPWDLPGKASMGEKEWYFFSLKDRKYPTGLRTNRATEAGYWKTTGKDKEILRGGVQLVGMKKTLEEWVVCRVFHKNSTAKKPQPTSSSSPQSDQDQSTCELANEFGDIDLPSFNLATPSIGSGTFTNISLQNYTNQEDMNLAALPSVLFRALQFRGNYNHHQPRDDPASTITSTRNYPFNIQSQGTIFPFGLDFNPVIEPLPSSSVVLDPLQSRVEQSHKWNSNIWE
ncbi:unnamed protein product [Withania somnifera]